jgi:hypothetical protein
MCVLALWLGVDPKSPLIVAANRDESYARPSEPPAEIEPGIVAGRDLQSGGTWLGFNRSGLFVAVTNRKTPVRSPASLSRGLLALEALGCRKLSCLEGLVSRRVEERPMAGFNLVGVAGGAGLALHWDGALRAVRFGPGAHVISSDRDLNDPELPEKSLLDRSFGREAPGLQAIQMYLASHEGDRPVCKHHAGFGTVSSAIYRTGHSLLFAPGPPCRTPYREIATSASPGEGDPSTRPRSDSPSRTGGGSRA